MLVTNRFVNVFYSLDMWDYEYSSDGLLGVAFLSEICDHNNGKASSVVKASPYDFELTVSTATHELGHK